MRGIKGFLKSYLTSAEQRIIFFLLLTGIVGIVIHYSGLSADSGEAELFLVELSRPTQVRYDINTVTAQALQTIPGIGAVRAEAIIEYRNAHKPIEVDDLINVRGIGEVTLAKIRDFFSDYPESSTQKDSEIWEKKNLEEVARDRTKMMNINEANLEDLMKIRGIGQMRGESILKYINENDRIKNIDQLLEIRGIGPKTIENIKEIFYADDDR